MIGGGNRDLWTVSGELCDQRCNKPGQKSCEGCWNDGRANSGDSGLSLRARSQATSSDW